jgi:hypothetical protein
MDIGVDHITENAEKIALNSAAYDVASVSLSISACASVR